MDSKNQFDLGLKKGMYFNQTKMHALNFYLLFFALMFPG